MTSKSAFSSSKHVIATKLITESENLRCKNYLVLLLMPQTRYYARFSKGSKFPHGASDLLHIIIHAIIHIII